ncbi:MAG: hypothetical protein HZY74_01485 [Brevundimonas sp.]|nr:MAG: hypothetical protein HZY74_01485 [Brevundimonas sp.]
MSVVSLHSDKLAGSFSFPNRMLRMTAMLNHEGPLWQIAPQPVRLERKPPNVMHASFASIADSFDGTAGSVSGNEHGLTGDFYLKPVYFDLLQQAALSAADLEIEVIFGARGGVVETLLLSIKHRLA